MSKTFFVFFFIVTFVVLFFVLLFGFFVFRHFAESAKVIGNQEVISEINRLLLPLDSKTLTENDFGKLQELVEDNVGASDEVEELILLAHYKEYSHVGHGLAFLYDYIKTGKEQVCPGHALSHYYVFSKYMEDDAAEDSLEEAEDSFVEWNAFMLRQNESYRLSKNYTFYYSLINSNLEGRSNLTEGEISDLANAPCIKN